MQLFRAFTVLNWTRVLTISWTYLWMNSKIKVLDTYEFTNVLIFGFAKPSSTLRQVYFHVSEMVCITVGRVVFWELHIKRGKGSNYITGRRWTISRTPCVVYVYTKSCIIGKCSIQCARSHKWPETFRTCVLGAPDRMLYSRVTAHKLCSFTSQSPKDTVGKYTLQ